MGWWPSNAALLCRPWRGNPLDGEASSSQSVNLKMGRRGRSRWSETRRKGHQPAQVLVVRMPYCTSAQSLSAAMLLNLCPVMVPTSPVPSSKEISAHIANASRTSSGRVHFPSANCTLKEGLADICKKLLSLQPLLLLIPQSSPPCCQKEPWEH